MKEVFSISISKKGGIAGKQSISKSILPNSKEILGTLTLLIN